MKFFQHVQCEGKASFDWGSSKWGNEKILEDELPDGYKYRIDFFKLVEKSEIPHENKFEAELAVNICNDEQADEFIKALGAVSGCDFNLERRDCTGKATGVISKALKCARNVRSGLNPKEVTKTAKIGCGQGRVKGMERQPGKNTNCLTTLKTKMAKCVENHENTEFGGCFNLLVKLNYSHSHEVESTHSWNFQEVGESARLRLLELFESGLSPANARKVFQEELKTKYGEDWLRISSKRSLNPDANYVSRLHTFFFKDRFGSINGPDAFQMAQEFIEKYNKENGQNVASIEQIEDSVIVCVVDELMRRVHAATPQSSQIMFVDGTGSLDRLNHQLIKLMTESPSGGLPLGFMILTDQKEKSLDAGFAGIKKLLPGGAFFGRGKERGPELIMTDDDRV